MSVSIQNNHTFLPELVEKAAAFPAGHYVEVDDLAYEMNGLGRKIVQTQLIRIGQRDVSVGYLADVECGNELILDEERPRDLGSFDAIIRKHAPVFHALQKAFGGSVLNYSHIEMVMGIQRAVQMQMDPNNEAAARNVAAWARLQAKRVTWVLSHRMDAITHAPVNWKTVGVA